MTRALVLQHARTGPPAILGEWLDARGVAYDLHDASTGAPLPDDVDPYAFVASLGAAESPNDTHVPLVAAEAAFLATAIERDVPILGLCFGGQMLAKLLGGTVERAPQPELGWSTIAPTPEAHGMVAAGPWLSWHYDRFTLPPGAQLLAANDFASQAFAHGPHLGTQFHPESTIDIVRVWGHKDRARSGVDDPDALLDRGAHHAQQAYNNAFQLFDGFLARTRARVTTDDRSISA